MNATVKSMTASGSVTEQWERIVRWLHTNVGAVPIAGATRAEIDAAAKETGIEWPSELVELFQCINGFPVEHEVNLLPQQQMLDLQRVIGERAMELDVWSDFDEEFGGPDPDSSAGDTAGTFHPAFVPFAGLDGYLLFVDTRPGPLHGCVTEFEKVDADDVGPRWVSLSAMLADLADSLETGGAFDRGWFPSVADGRIEWDYAPGE